MTILRGLCPTPTDAPHTGVSARLISVARFDGLTRVPLILCLAALISLPDPAHAQQAAAVAEPTTANQWVIPGDEELPGAGPMRRYDWFRNLWKKRRQSFANQAASQKGSVVFLGDSITQGWKDNFGGAFGDLPKANRGISGDTTRGMLFRLQEDVLQLAPKAVVMLMGTNDLEEKATPATIADNVKLILDGLTGHNAEMPIVLCEVFPSSSKKARPADKIKEINRLCREVAKAYPQVTVLDTWTLFADANGDAKQSEFPDLLHPNGAGYAKWESALRPVLATLGLLETKPDDFEIEDDAESLFNGKDLTGWQFLRTTDAMRKSRARWIPKTNGAIVWPLVDEAISFDGKKQTPGGRYRAIAGRLVVTTPVEGRKIQQLWTQREFPDDFQLILEFRATPAADSGVFLRGKQLQCRDFPLAGPYKQLRQFRSGDWNELVVTVKGQKAYCTCNGEVIEEAFEIPETGPIGLEGDRGQIEYRRIRLRQPE